MVPPAIPGAGDEDWLPLHDPDRARDLLEAAGHAGGAGLPTIHLADGGASIADAIAADLERELGMHVEIESLDEFFDRISGDPPHLWISSWIADYPGPNDFLGVLLESDSSENRGGWASPAFDQAISDALATRDPSRARLRSSVPSPRSATTCPPCRSYSSTDWSLVREGLLGAGGNGMGIPRIAGMAWSE